MKLGILTFSKAINYGAALQATALRKVLLNQAEKVCFLDYSCKAIDSASKIFDITTSTGDKDVPQSTSGALCKINTDTGDIEITIAN